MQKQKNYSNLIVIYGICLCILLFSFSIAEPWNKDSVAAQILLKSNEIPDFTLKNSGKYSQDWISKDEEKKSSFSFILTVFNSPAEAILGTGSLARGASSILSYGSFLGPILGNHSWVHSSYDKSGRWNVGTYFVKDNIGVLVMIWGITEPEKTKVEQITRQIIDKINKVAQPEIKIMFDQVRKLQIAAEEFGSILQEPRTVQLKGYSMVTENDTIWTNDTNTFLLGRRYELRDTSGNFIGIDIAKFSSNELAKKAGRERTKTAITALWVEDVSNPIDSLPWWWDKSYGSVVFAKGNYAVHIYQFSPGKSIDISTFSKLIPAIANRIP
ncbi:MAG: hypothetical protein QME64_05175 [bacterium]|nr:hypothetical protein [bacterium]